MRNRFRGSRFTRLLTYSLIYSLTHSLTYNDNPHPGADADKVFEIFAVDLHRESLSVTNPAPAANPDPTPNLYELFVEVEVLGQVVAHDVVASDGDVC